MTVWQLAKKLMELPEDLRDTEVVVLRYGAKRKLRVSGVHVLVPERGSPERRARIMLEWAEDEG